MARFVAARLRTPPPAVEAVAQALAVLGDDASLADTAAVAGVDRTVAADAVDVMIEAELLTPGLPPRFVHPIIQQALHDSIPPAGRAQLHLAAARELARDPARCERVAAHLLAAAGPAGEQWAFDALTAAARRAGDHGSPAQAVRFLRRALDEAAPAASRRALLLDLGAAESAARMPEAAARMEEASACRARRPSAHTRRSACPWCGSSPASCRRRSPSARTLLGSDDGLDRELRLGLEFQVAATRMVGGLPSAETFGRLLALEPEVSRGETAAERSLLAMIAVMFAATTARSAAEVAALAEAAWGDGQLLVEVRSEHPALAAPATTIALTAATIAIALAGRLTRAIEVWTAGVEEGQARSSLLLYSNSLGAARLRHGPGSAISPAPSPTPSPRWSCSPPATRSSCPPRCPRSSTSTSSTARSSGPWRCSATRGRPASCRRRSACARRWLPAAGSPCGWAIRRAALIDLEEAGRRSLEIAYVNPMALLWRSYAALASARLGERDRARELIEEELEIARRFGAPEPIGEALRVRALLAPGGEMVEIARDAVDVLAGSELRVAHARALIDLGAALRRGAIAATPGNRCAKGSTSPTGAARWSRPTGRWTSCEPPEPARAAPPSAASTRSRRRSAASRRWRPRA